MEECRQLREWALSTPPRPSAAATPEQIEKHLSFLAATLPTKNLDDDSGRKRFAVYVSLLGQNSDAALAFMSRTACQTLNWFPTPRQCLEIIAEYRPPVSEQELALRLCDDFTQGSFEIWLQRVKAGEQLGDVPEQWNRIAVEQGVVRRLSDGSYVSRMLYHGPFKAYAHVG